MLLQKPLIRRNSGGCSGVRTKLPKVWSFREGCGNIARHAFTTIPTDDAADHRNCRNVVEQLPRSCRTIAPEAEIPPNVGPSWPMWGKFGPCRAEFHHVLTDRVRLTGRVRQMLSNIVRNWQGVGRLRRSPGSARQATVQQLFSNIRTTLSNLLVSTTPETPSDTA